MISFDNVTKAFRSSLHTASDSHSTCLNGCQPLYLELSCDLRGVVCMRMGTEGFFLVSNVPFLNVRCKYNANQPSRQCKKVLVLSLFVCDKNIAYTFTVVRACCQSHKFQCIKLRSFNK